jgi:hypothetical protein
MNKRSSVSEFPLFHSLHSPPSQPHWLLLQCHTPRTLQLPSTSTGLVAMRLCSHCVCACVCVCVCVCVCLLSALFSCVAFALTTCVWLLPQGPCHIKISSPSSTHCKVSFAPDVAPCAAAAAAVAATTVVVHARMGAQSHRSVCRRCDLHTQPLSVGDQKALRQLTLISTHL